MDAVVTRFAPSPTGRLHLGHVFAAAFARDLARAAGSRYLVRIEDLDFGRCRPEYEAAILDDLAWLGLAGDAAVRRQSQHLADYRAALDRLQALGVLYPCFCSRRRIAEEIRASAGAPQGPEGPHYPGICRGLSAAERRLRVAGGESYALRLDCAKAAALAGRAPGFVDEERGRFALQPERFGDVALARKELPASYHLAVVVDDALQGISLVTRGEDLLPATHVHCLLQSLLGLPTPRYRHHRLLSNAHGARLSKRDGAAAIEALRRTGLQPAEVLALARSR
ncbi:MAG: tRNA glutamyl-Q(34) synthetase GluQRS [Alphaproteobacteria bacterium]|nr:tRNA glutamyl-Q(34) synthetase GluQRS [Alphaproteobacteria bacterium]